MNDLENKEKDEDIIDFEQLFADEKKNDKQLDFTRVPFYLSTIVFYFLRSLFGALIALVLLLIPALTPPITHDELVIEQVALDVNGFGFGKTELLHKYYGLVADFPIENSEYSYILNSNNADYLTSGFLGLMEINYFPEILSGKMTNFLNGGPITFYIDEFNEQTIRYLDLEIADKVADREYYDLLRLSPFGYSIYQGIILLLSASVSCFLLKKDLVNDINIFKDKDKRFRILPQVITGTLYVFAAYMILSLIIGLINQIPGINHVISDNQLLINFIMRGSGIPIMVITTVLLAPIVEELVFRKSIFGLFKNENIGLIVSSILFGLVHIIGEITTLRFFDALTNGILYIGLGFIFGYLYKKNDKNIYINIFVHAAYNLIAAILMFI